VTDPFVWLGSAIVRFRWLVLGIWAVVLLAFGGLVAPRAAGLLRGGGYVDPDSESAQAARILDREFNASTGNSVAVVLQSPTQTVDQPEFQAQAVAAIQRIQALAGVKSVDSVFTTGNPLLVSVNRRTTFVVVALRGSDQETQRVVLPVRNALQGLTIQHYVTGVPALNYDSEVISEEDLHRSEMFTIPIVVVLLLVVFGTLVAAAMPLIVGACSVVMALAIIAIIAGQTNLSIFALNVSSMIGLGLGIDFSLVMVNRFREEVAGGRSTNDAVVATMATAGRSITYSAVTVLLGTLVLTLLFNLMVIRSISLAVMLVAITALLAGLTLLPAVIAVLGPRIEWLPVKPRSRRASTQSGGFWYSLSHAIMRRPWIWLLVSLVLLIGIGQPVRDLRLYGTEPGILPDRAESVRGAKAVNEAFGANRLTPIQVVVQTGKGGIFEPGALTLIQRLTEVAQADPRNEQVLSLLTLAQQAGLPTAQLQGLTPELLSADPSNAKFARELVNLDGNRDATVITVFSKFNQYSPQHEGFVYDLRHDVRAKNNTSLAQLNQYTVLVGGEAASFLDFKDNMYGRFPYLIAAVMLLTFLILMMFFHSVFLPLKAIFMNLASILATYGALILIFQNGWGHNILGFTELHGLAEFTPVMLFVILFGLSTDYEVFMLSRVKEYYHETGKNEEAVAAGLESTASVITAAGLILIGTFGSFASADVLIVKEIGLGLAIGVLIDSTIVRVIMVPATMRLMGNANWWMPGWLRRIVPELREGAALPAPSPAVAFAGERSLLHSAGAGLDAPSALAAEPGWAASSVPPAGAMSEPAEERLWPGPARTDQAAPTPTRLAQPQRVPTLLGRLRSVGASVGADLIVLPHRRPFRIGRGQVNELWLFDQRISRRQAEIFFAENGFYLSDLGSGNGTFVNGRRVDGTLQLQQGDEVELGGLGTVRFIYEQRLVEEPAPSG